MRLLEVRGKDGMVREIAKLYNAVAYWKNSEAMKEARGRVGKNLNVPHDLTNVCVESCRDTNYQDASYLAGHVLMISLTTNIILIGVTTCLVG
jgi:hypothetical protein